MSTITSEAAVAALESAIAAWPMPTPAANRLRADFRAALNRAAPAATAVTPAPAHQTLPPDAQAAVNAAVREAVAAERASAVVAPPDGATAAAKLAAEIAGQLPPNLRRPSAAETQALAQEEIDREAEEIRQHFPNSKRHRPAPVAETADDATAAAKLAAEIAGMVEEEAA